MGIKNTKFQHVWLVQEESAAMLILNILSELLGDIRYWIVNWVELLMEGKGGMWLTCESKGESKSLPLWWIHLWKVWGCIIRSCGSSHIWFFLSEESIRADVQASGRCVCAWVFSEESRRGVGDSLLPSKQHHCYTSINLFNPFYKHMVFQSWQKSNQV